MQHIESSVHVFFSTDYGKFKMLTGNRQLNEGKINRIIREISDGNDMLKYYPIQVKENKERLEILDGQHRFYISKHLKRPVFYILVKEEKSMPDIARINSNVEKWKPSDYVNCYAQQNNEHYKCLQDFNDKYGFSNSVSLKLLKFGHPGVEGSDKSLSEDFKNGFFTVDSKQEAIDFADDILKFNFYPQHKDRGFIIALYRIKKAAKVNLNELLEAVSKKASSLVPQHSYKEHVYQLEQVINIGKKTRITLI